MGRSIRRSRWRAAAGTLRPGDICHILLGHLSSLVLARTVFDYGMGTAIEEPWQGHRDGMTSVVFSPDGTQVVSGSRANTIRLWNAASGTVIGEPLQRYCNRIPSVSLSPTVHALSRAPTLLAIWDIPIGLHPLRSPPRACVLSRARVTTPFDYGMQHQAQSSENLQGHVD